MDEKLNNDKSFEQKNQQKRKNNPNSASVPTASYREIRAKSESERKKKVQSSKSKTQNNQNDRRRPQQDKKPIQQNKSQKNQRKQSKPSADDGKSRPQSSSQVKQKTSGNSQKQSVDNLQKQRINRHNPDINNPQNEHQFAPDESQKRVPQQNKPTHTQEQNQNNTQNPPENKAKKKHKMKRSSKPFSAKKRRRKILAMYSSMVVVILMIAAVLCLTVFFKIDSITVEGDTRYSTEEIIEASGITVGTNLLLCNTEPGKEVITKKFPYIESVTIKKNPFNSVTIYVEEAKPTTAIETNGKFYILSTSGKIIEILDNNKYNVPLIKGAELKKTELSATIEYKLSSMNNIINEVTEALENNDITKVSTINVTSPSNVKLDYDKRLTIILGIPENVDYKIKTAKVIINDKLEKNSKGTIDVSMCAEGGKYSYYDPSGAPEN